jgi:hypothetical protein
MTVPLSIVRGPVARQDVIGALPKADHEPFTLADWIQLIQQAWTRGADRALELGRLLSRARESLPRGSWSRLWQSRELPFSKRKGEMLVVIGQGVGGLNAQNSARLPAAWNTLYYVARLGQTLVEQLIRQGRIHPELSLREAQVLLAEYHLGTQRKTPRSKLEIRIRRLAAFIRAAMGGWSPTEREWVRKQLLVLAGEIQRSASLQVGTPRPPSAVLLRRTGRGVRAPAGEFRGTTSPSGDDSSEAKLPPSPSPRFANGSPAISALPDSISSASPRHTIPIPVL